MRPASQRVVIAHTREPKYTEGSGADDGVGLGAVDRLPPDGSKTTTTVEPGHTISTEDRSRVHMLLSFQRPSHLYREGASFPQARPGADVPAPERTDEYSAESGARNARR